VAFLSLCHFGHTCIRRVTANLESIRLTMPIGLAAMIRGLLPPAMRKSDQYGPE
jgi:hypothetical protein